MRRSLDLFCLIAAALVAAPVQAAPDAGYDLLANAPLAHVWRDGVVADAASPGFVKYTRDMNGSWRLGIKEDGRPGAYVPGLQANLWIPIGPELLDQPLAVEATFKPIGSDQRVDVFVEGDKVQHLVLQPGWQTHKIEIPAGKAKGLTQVRLHFRRSVDHQGGKTAAAIRYVRVGKASAAPLPGDEAGLASALAYGAGDTLALPDGGGLDYYVVPAKGMTLVGNAAGGTVEVETQLDGKKPTRLGGGAALALSLDPVAGKPVRLMLRGKGGAVKLAGGRMQGGTAKAPAVTKPKYVVFWLIDTLRADKLPFYQIPNANGRPKVETPNLSALAQEAVVFEPFWVQGNESKASHASLFTGTYPVVHRVFTHEANLPDPLTTIAEAFKKAGYKTGGYCANGYVSDRWNFDQGFAKGDFRNFIREGGANNAKAIVKAAKGFIDANKDKPFYLYLGTSDPHVTYRAHKEFIGKYDTGPAYTGRYMKNLSGEELGKIKGQKSPPGERDRKRIEALYENEIAFNDKHFGELVAHLKAAGIYDDTMIIVSSDHGDEFWEHGSAGHGHNLHQELINVPLMIRFPGALKGKRAEFGTDGVDLLPTLMTVLGQAHPDDVQGQDVLPLVAAEGAVYPRATVASMGTGSYALQVGPAKVIMRSERSITAYDTKADPAEKSDVFGDKVVLSMAAMDPLSLFLSRAAKWDKAKWGAPNNLTPGALR